jgi:Cdc6-like AAA superfamily ATPase
MTHNNRGTDAGGDDVPWLEAGEEEEEISNDPPPPPPPPPDKGLHHQIPPAEACDRRHEGEERQQLSNAAGTIDFQQQQQKQQQQFIVTNGMMITTTTNHNNDDGENPNLWHDPSMEPQQPSSTDPTNNNTTMRQARIACLDEALQRLSDCESYHHSCLSSSSLSVPTTNPFQLSYETKQSPPTMDGIIQFYAPLTMEGQFQELYCTFRDMHRTSASAFVQGARGTGKSLLVSAVLRALTDELHQSHSRPAFRRVHVHGIATPGHSVETVVREILQQLSNIAAEASSSSTWEEGEAKSSQDEEGQPSTKKRPRTGRVDRTCDFLRLKQTSFTNQLQLLTEILQLASVDGIPVLIILDELDTFIRPPKSNAQRQNQQHQPHHHHHHQLLLYHLLERVSTAGSLCSVIGMTTDSAILLQLEKRIKSRAEGTAKFIVTGPCPSYSDDLVRVLVHHFQPIRRRSGGSGDVDTVTATELQNELTAILHPPTSHEQASSRIYPAMVRDHGLGKDMRWFSRVLYLVLAMYRHDLVLHKGSASVPRLQAKYVEEALGDMGSSIVQGMDVRMQALCDLTGPQVALVLAARRILVRDSGRRHQQEQPPQLNLRRLLFEYASSFRKAASGYSGQILKCACMELLETGIFRLASNHSGVGPFQYRFRDDLLYKYGNIDLLQHMPLQLTVDIHREIKHALDKNMFQCSTALREWGRKTN